MNVTNDAVRPVITGVSFGDEGSTNQGVLDRFTLSFSEDMYAAAVNTATNYDLRAAGADGVFGNGDDVRYVVAPSYTNGLCVTNVIASGPLQPGWYRFTATTNLTDRAGNRLAANFVRTFWVLPRAGFTLENRDNDASAGATPLALVEDPSGLRWRVGQGNLGTSSDQDWWSFTGNPGQVVTVAMDAPGDPSGANWYCSLYRPDGNQMTGSSFWPRGTLGPVTLSEAGEYRVRVSGYSTWYSYEYWVRVSVAVPPVQMESEENGSLGNADALTLVPGAGGSQTARVAGCVETNDAAGDYFLLGTLGAGVTVNLDLTQPESSPLVGQLTLYKDGSYVALGNDGETHLGYVIPSGEGGQYAARIKAAQNPGLLAQYVLDVNVGTGTAPTITTVSPLPSGTVGVAYSQTLQATGGSPPYVWQLVSSLPSGLSLNTNTGTISGAPTVAGLFNPSFRVRGSNGLASVKTLALEVYTVNPAGYHTSDYRDPRWVIDGTEASRVLAYWRAGAYHLDTSGWDGYAGGTGSTNGARHNADYATNYWLIDGTEANRVLSYWRAGAYHADTNGLDGFAPGQLSFLTGGREYGPGPLPRVSASQEAPATYRPGSAFAIKAKLDYAAQPLSLLWRPRLPKGWKLQAAAGDGNPEVSEREILWTGDIPKGVINLEVLVEVPDGDQGLKEIQGEVESHFAGQPNPAKIAAAPSLVLGEEGSGFCQLTSVERLPNGQVHLGLRAELGRRYEIQVSRDLVEWMTLTTVLSDGGVVQVGDSETAAEQKRFYRARLVP